MKPVTHSSASTRRSQSRPDASFPQSPSGSNAELTPTIKNRPPASFVKEQEGIFPALAKRIEDIERALRMYSKPRRPQSFPWLLFEIFSLLLVALCMGGASVIHSVLTSDMTEIIVWNIFLGMCIFRAIRMLGLLVAIALRRLRPRKRMWAFEIFDNGSRGPCGLSWGSLLILPRLRGDVVAVASTLTLVLYPSLHCVVEYKDGASSARILWRWWSLYLGLLPTFVAITWACAYSEQPVGVWKTSDIATILYGLPNEWEKKTSPKDEPKSPPEKDSGFKKTVIAKEPAWQVGRSDSGEWSIQPHSLGDFPETKDRSARKYWQHVEDDATSVGASHAISVFSARSLASSLPSDKGSTKDIGSDDLLAFFLIEPTLTRLYRKAAGNVDLEPTVFQSALETLIQQFSAQLESDAADYLEFKASRLISKEAATISLRIVNLYKFKISTVPLEKQIKLRAVYRLAKKADDSSAKLISEQKLVEGYDVDSIVSFLLFLMRSNALQAFRTELQHLALREPSQVTEEDAIIKKKETQPIHSIFFVTASRVGHVSKKMCTAIGRLEPPLNPGMVRLRWNCRCGEKFTTDAREYETGGTSELKASMETLCGREVTTTSYSPNSTNQKIIYPQPILWYRRVISSLAAVFQRSPEQSSLPQHNARTTPIASQGAPPRAPKRLHLLSCVRSAHLGHSLSQDCIDDIDTDRKFFHYLGTLFRCRRGRFRIFLALRRVIAIHFIKLNLYEGGSVEVRHHSGCCKNFCECIPPQSRVEPSNQAEYRCSPAGPLAGGPPIDPKFLQHFFIRPSCIPESSTSILNKLPKRICGELQGSASEPAEGWGIYFQEGWNGDIIMTLVFILFLMGSLLFGALWACLKMDLQGAFGVSAYMMTANTILISLVAARASKD
ncbi:hypothetical protein CC80DRAFT_494485 [Byssothecium circinans]|uniref:Uncharacterized protein n=1 Tax=Byssothecium circinans TaxID=147558 RepID=A0A6A5TMG3_9PLEO|nr:hypothetical protein CC80DRAFT_494485 [Byssothecium circinans]